MTAKLINNEDEYKRYLKEVGYLMDKDPAINTPEGERLSMLALAIQAYEKEHFSFKKPSPVEAIRFRMEQQNLKQSDLIPYIGSKSKVSEVLSGKKALSIPMIRALNKFLDISLEILIQEDKQELSKINLDNTDWSMFPFKEMEKRGWLTSSMSEYKKDPKGVMDEFCKPIGGLLAQGVMWKRSFHNRTQENSNTYELLAWSTRVMILAEGMKVADYDKSLITMEYLKELSKLSQFTQGPLLAREMLAKNGIKLIFQAQLPKTKIDGGCFLDDKGHPIIGMTLRYDRIDNFWHTLLHEMAHVYKHLNKTISFIDDLDSDPKGDPQEKEADKIAQESFIPRVIWKRSDAFISRTPEAIFELSKKLGIHPAIVAGRIRFETKDYKFFSDLIGQGQIRSILKEHINE